MSDEAPESVDLWDVLEEAEQTVQRWPPWQRQYEADIYYDEDAPADSALKALVIPRAVLVCMSGGAATVH
jgi:hypothetical protein